MFKNLRKKKKGFTLIELIIVIAIIGILASIAIPKFGEATKKAKDNAELANAKSISSAVAVAMAEGEDDFTEGEGGFIEVTGDKFKKYLQEIPKTSDNNNFFIKINTNGNVTVFNSKATGASPIYPAE